MSLAPSVARPRADGAGRLAARTATLRANPDYELVPLERLPGPEREVLVRAAGDDELYGLLRPKGDPTLAPRAATTDLALLLLTLRDPGPLPAFAADRLGGEAEEAIARLVLDRVLELEHDGEFVSGPRALGAAAEPDSAVNPIAELSLAALRHAQSLAGMPEEILTASLYGFGRRPLTPRLAGRLGDEHAIADLLGVKAVAARTGWAESGTAAGDPWRMWRRRQRRSGQGGRSTSYKLYVAPTLDALPDVFATVAECLAEIGACQGFKVARDAPGLCRPDKLVAYFGRLEDLHAAAAGLGGQLHGATAQPVPFTGRVDGAGLLSWGIDPSAGAQAGRSWRLWLAGRLASYLVEAMAGGGEGEPWRFALERVRLDGIDVESWAPATSGWTGLR